VKRDKAGFERAMDNLNLTDHHKEVLKSIYTYPNNYLKKASRKTISYLQKILIAGDKSQRENASRILTNLLPLDTTKSFMYTYPDVIHDAVLYYRSIISLYVDGGDGLRDERIQAALEALNHPDSLIAPTKMDLSEWDIPATKISGNYLKIKINNNAELEAISCRAPVKDLKRLTRRDTNTNLALSYFSAIYHVRFDEVKKIYSDYRNRKTASVLAEGELLTPILADDFLIIPPTILFDAIKGRQIRIEGKLKSAEQTPSS
jgi:hypothetical protein